MLVTDRRLAGGEDALVDAVAEAVEGGVNVVQLREKDLSPAQLLALARKLRKVTAGRALLVVNGPVEVALAADADGIHLPEEAQGPGSEQRRFVCGRSIHSLEAAARAAAEGTDYVVAGPVYATASHPGRPPAGPGFMRKVVSATPVPVIGIGGITATNATEVMGAGASGVAVISAILGSAAPGSAARRLWQVVESGWHTIARAPAPRT